MKLSLVTLLSAITASLTLVVRPELQLQIELPDTRFKIQTLFDSPLLPVNSTLAVITYFMSGVARNDFDQVLEPSIYRSRKYPTVAIRSYSSTETRFLLWGVYLTAIDMVKYIRFNEVIVNLLWNNQLVGQISVLAITAESISSTCLNETSGSIDDREGLRFELISNKTSGTSVERLNIPTLQNGTRTATVSNTSADSSIDTWNTACSSPSSPSIDYSNNASLSTTLAVDFQSVAGAIRLKRNAVFLSFYAAMLHVAKFPVGDQMQRFDSQAPDVMLRVHMFHIGIGCSVRLSTSLILTINVKQIRWS